MGAMITISIAEFLKQNIQILIKRAGIDLFKNNSWYQNYKIELMCQDREVPKYSKRFFY
jgi:hypothetical protein